MGGSDHCYILDAVATIKFNILTANNGVVNLIKS